MNRVGTAPSPETLPPRRPAPRLVVFGLRCRFTDVVINELKRAGQAPLAIFYPGPPGYAAPVRLQPPARLLPMVGQIEHPSADETARFQIGKPGASATIELLESLAPDVLAVACYPRRLPRRLVKVARVGALNVHPSLLPRHRGPDPLFWTLREGTGEAGVTIHALTEQLDAGPIVAQQRSSYRAGTTEEELEHQLATQGGFLLAELLANVGTGGFVGKDQPIGEAIYESWPTEDDYVIDTDRTARSAFTFIRGVSERGVPTGIRTDNRVIWVERAVAWTIDEPPVTPHIAVVPFREGFLSVMEYMMSGQPHHLL